MQTPQDQGPRRPRRRVALAAIAAITGALAARGPAVAAPAATTAPAKPALTVTPLIPRHDDWPLAIPANGSLSAWQEAVIAAQIGGLQVVELAADVGTRVRRGDELARLAQDSVLADLALQEARVQQAVAALSEAQANGRRARELAGRATLTGQQSTQYLVAEESAKANLAAAQAQLRSQQIRLDQTRIRAVDDGIVAARAATLGSVVQVGSELFRLVRQNRIEWRAEVMAEQLARIRPGQRALVRVAGGATLEGLVRVTAPTFDPATRLALVYVDLPEPGNAHPGDFARGEIIVGRSPALTVPESAVVLRDGNSYLFAIGDDQRVVQHKVTTGRRADDRVEILDGLPAAVPLVASGGAFLNDGDSVHPVAAPGAATDRP